MVHTVRKEEQTLVIIWLVVTFIC